MTLVFASSGSGLRLVTARDGVLEGSHAVAQRRAYLGQSSCPEYQEQHDHDDGNLRQPEPADPHEFLLVTPLQGGQRPKPASIIAGFRHDGQQEAVPIAMRNALR